MKTLLTTLLLLLAAAPTFANAPGTRRVRFKNQTGVQVSVSILVPGYAARTYLRLDHGKSGGLLLAKGHRWLARETSTGLLIRSAIPSRSETITLNSLELAMARAGKAGREKRAREAAAKKALQDTLRRARKQREAKALKVRRALDRATQPIRDAARAQKRLIHIANTSGAILILESTRTKALRINPRTTIQTWSQKGAVLTLRCALTRVIIKRFTTTEAVRMGVSNQDYRKALRKARR